MEYHLGITILAGAELYKMNTGCKPQMASKSVSYTLLILKDGSDIHFVSNVCLNGNVTCNWKYISIWGIIKEKKKLFTADLFLLSAKAESESLITNFTFEIITKIRSFPMKTSWFSIVNICRINHKNLVKIYTQSILGSRFIFPNQNKMLILNIWNLLHVWIIFLKITNNNNNNKDATPW